MRIKMQKIHCDESIKWYEKKINKIWNQRKKIENLRWENMKKKKKNIHSNLWILNKSYNNWLEDILQWI